MAEDIRALARSLARDLHEASRSAHGNTRSATRSATDAVKQSLREAAQDARSELRREIRKEFGRHASRSRWAKSGWWVPPEVSQAWPGSSGPGADPTVSGGDPPPAGPSWSRPPGHHRHHGRSGPAEMLPVRAIPPVRRRWDAPVVAAALGATVVTAWLLSAVGVLAVPAEPVMALALMILGAAVVVSARTDWSLSRHAWPVFVGLALIIGLFATSSTYGVGGAFTHLSIGNSTVTPMSSETVYGGVGQLTVDLTKAAPGTVIQVRSLVGQTVLELSSTESYTISGRVLAGQVCTSTQSASGIGASASSGTGTGVVVDVHQLAGTVRVAGKHCGRQG